MILRMLPAITRCLFTLGLIVSCKKQAVLVPSPTYATLSTSSQKETGAPVMRKVSHPVHKNIGGYLEVLPANYHRDQSAKYPLLVFLPGQGQLGNGTTDLHKLEWYGTPYYIKQGKFPASFTVNNTSYSFIVICPQFKNWPSPKEVDAMIKHATSQYRVDAARIYITGASMGGGNTWDYASYYGKKLAAIIPICGASAVSDTKAKNLAASGVAIWAFHNNDDNKVKADKTKDYITSITKHRPSIHPGMTIWPAGGHDAWTKATDPAYKQNGMNMYEWMLRYKRKV